MHVQVRRPAAELDLGDEFGPARRGETVIDHATARIHDGDLFTAKDPPQKMPMSALLAVQLAIERDEHGFARRHVTQQAVAGAFERHRLARDHQIVLATGPGALADGATIEGVGVYQGAGARLEPGHRPRGTVEVRVRRGARPVLLVLTSYEPVEWKIVPESGARIAGVLIGGYHPSFVTGAGPVRVQQIGRDYAYQRDGEAYQKLQTLVTQLVGRPIGPYQARYEASSFTVGGP